MATSQMNEIQAAMRIRASITADAPCPDLRTDNVWPLADMHSTTSHRQRCRIDVFAEHSRHPGRHRRCRSLLPRLDHSRQVAIVSSPNRLEQSILKPGVPTCKRQCWSQEGMISVPRELRSAEE